MKLRVKPKYVHFPAAHLQLSAGNCHCPERFTFILISLFLFCSMFTAGSFAQYTYQLDKTTRFDKIDAEKGLSSELITCIHQDKYGFIWIGTQIGLNLYDGYEVKVFDLDPNDPGSLFHNNIIDMYEEPDGTMWFCTEIGISRYNRQNQTFSNYIPDTIDFNNFHNEISQVVQDGIYLWVRAGTDLLRFNKETGQFNRYAKDTLDPSSGIYSNSVDYLLMDGSGTLWVATTKPGKDEELALNKFNKESGTFEHFLHEMSYPDSRPGGFIWTMIEDREGTLWLATTGYGLIELTDKKRGTFKYYTHNENDKNSILNNTIRTIFEDAKGNIWTGGAEGFSLFNKATGQFTNFKVPRIDQPEYFNYIRGIHEDRYGDLWMNTVDGLLKFNPSLNLLTQYFYERDNPAGISDINLRDVMIDQTDQVWIATWSNGVATINPFSNAFKIIKRKPGNNKSLSDNFVSRFLKDSRGNLWIGCYQFGGLNRTKIDNHKDYDNFEHFVFEVGNPNSLTGNWINPIYEDRDQIIWVGTFTGLNSYDYRTNNFTRYKFDPLDSTSLSWNIVEAVFEDSHGTFWVGTREGLNILNRETGKFIHYLPDENDPTSILSRKIVVIFEDSFGELWFGGDFLEKLNRKDTSFIHFTPESGNAIDVYRNDISAIKEDDSNNLWLASQNGGLFKMNQENSKFEVITTDHGLPSNELDALELDDNGNLWVTTQYGLSRINPDNLEIKNFDIADGLVNRDLIFRSLYKDNEGCLYVGGKDGFNVFHPDSIKENKFIPPVYITSLNVAGEPKYFDKPLYEIEDIELQYNENDFSFDFVALNYINSQKNQYAYMLEGYDEDWIQSGSRRTAFYTNLSPGNYTFRVKGSNNDGYWNEEGANLAVVILPPFWKTWWAYVIYAITFFVLVYLVRRNELRKINLRQELELEKVNAENLAELDKEKNIFFSNISHEFRTPLTLILGPLDRVIERLRNEDNKTDLSIVRRSALRLQTLVNQLLSLSKLESGKMKLKARPENIVKLIRLYLQSFYSMAEDRGIKLELENYAEEYMVYVDTIKFEKVVNNLLSNAFKFTKKGGKISVSVMADFVDGLDGIIIKVIDTGAGIPKENLPHVFDRFYQVDEKQMKTNLGTGIGLALTKELVELHHGTITVESEPGKGTTFTIFLPVGTDHLSEDEIVNKSKNELETDDDLLNDDYLFVRDVATIEKIKKNVPEDNELPLLLIVEDNEDMRSYIKSYLNDKYSIIEAEDGKEGAEKAIEHIPDLIVSDLMMPKLDGNQMTTRLKTDERTSHIPIILLTAKASRESKLEGLETGADDFLTKPFDADELLVRINNLVNQRKKLREIYGKKLSYTSSPKPTDLKDTGITSMDEQFLSKAYKVAEREMSDPEFGVVTFSKQMGMSRMQLHRKIKALTDQTGTEFIRTVRLNKAAVFLKSKSATVAEIAYDVGFNNPTYFSSSFKEHFGKTPLDFSKQ